jgi:hypothetical protein
MSKAAKINSFPESCAKVTKISLIPGVLGQKLPSLEPALRKTISRYGKSEQKTR